MTSLVNTFTSTGSKFFAHQEAMVNLRNGRGQPIVTHVMLTDVCNHTCAFCSVQKRSGDTLPYSVVLDYLDILLRYDLKAVILSGGGNPILYKCKESGKDFNDVVSAIHERGLEIGLITNGMPLREYTWLDDNIQHMMSRRSWKTVEPETLDKLTWIRISMSGLDHAERCVYVPDVDRKKTTLGFSYVAHDIYKEPADPHHGKVSRQLDLISRDKHDCPDEFFEERFDWLTNQISANVLRHDPKYVRLLPNCLEPDLITGRYTQLSMMAKHVNQDCGREVAFVQYKPPAPPKACYLGYVHPVLNCDGYVYPCDSCVLNESAEHAFSNPWRVCRWDEVARIYDEPVRSLIADTKATCPGCVFTNSNEVLRSVVEGGADLTQRFSGDHPNFV